MQDAIDGVRSTMRVNMVDETNSGLLVTSSEEKWIEFVMNTYNNGTLWCSPTDVCKNIYMYLCLYIV